VDPDQEMPGDQTTTHPGRLLESRARVALAAAHGAPPPTAGPPPVSPERAVDLTAAGAALESLVRASLVSVAARAPSPREARADGAPPAVGDLVSPVRAADHMMAGLVTVGPPVSPERVVDPAVVTTGATIGPPNGDHLASLERVAALGPEAGTVAAVGDLVSPERVDLLAVVIGVTIIRDGDHLESPVRAVDLTATAGTVAVGLLASPVRAADHMMAGLVTVGPPVSPERVVDHTAAGAAAVGLLESPERVVDLTAVGPLLESLARAVDLTAAGAATVGRLASPERVVDLTATAGEVTVESLARVADHMATLETDGTLKTIGPLESPARADLEVEAGEVTVGPPLESPERAVVDLTAAGHQESPERAVDLTAAGDVMIAAAGHLASLERAVDLTAPHGAALAGPLLESLARVVDGK